MEYIHSTPPIFGQHQERSRLHNWALNRLQNRHDIHKDIQKHNIQILQQSSLTLKLEITVRLNIIVQQPFPLDPPNITAQSLPPPVITEISTYLYLQQKQDINTTDIQKRQSDT